MVAPDPRRRSMLCHYKILSVVTPTTGNWSRCILPLARRGLASPRDILCVRKGIPVDSCYTALSNVY